MYENKFQPLASQKVFYSRIFKSVLWSTIILSVSLFIGMFGYHVVGNQSWIDSFLNASMILAGMGPIDTFENASDIGKLFGGFYALFSGVIFLSVFAIIIAPIIHRFFHKFHLEMDNEKN